MAYMQLVQLCVVQPYYSGGQILSSDSPSALPLKYSFCPLVSSQCNVTVTLQATVYAALRARVAQLKITAPHKLRFEFEW